MDDLSQLADAVARKLDADVVLFNATLLRPADKNLIAECMKRRKRKNVMLLLVTAGGNPDAAYRMARCFQTQYERFTLYVSGFCKSAGTLVAVGAHDLIMSDHGELGPLDVQMPKQDDLWEMQSGLTVIGILETLQREAVKTFHKVFENLMEANPGSITLRTAAEIASKMTSGLYAPLYSQVDPLHLGEAGRAMKIAGIYGTYLLNTGRNIDQAGLLQIMSGYPSHSFVIDRREANNLFSKVQEPSEDEIALAEALGDEARIPILRRRSQNPPFRFLSTELPLSEENEQTDDG